MQSTWPRLAIQKARRAAAKISNGKTSVSKDYYPARMRRGKVIGRVVVVVVDTKIAKSGDVRI